MIKASWLDMLTPNCKHKNMIIPLNEKPVIDHLFCEYCERFYMPEKECE